MSKHILKVSGLATAVALVSMGVMAQERLELEPVYVLGTAQEELKQALGSSVITSEDIARRPPVNDLSEIIRTMPGVNLTGNSTSGQRGNNRQIDIRGMGPENTLILIDGKPVASRNSVRMGWRGERDSRGDSNWVPANQVERIEVLRGPAAARYGNGASGGVVNIITKQPTDGISGQVSAMTTVPQHSDEGATRRFDFSLNGPVTEGLTFRLYGNLNKTDSDDKDINFSHRSERTGVHVNSWPSGREGVRNRDINGLLAWELSPSQLLKLEAGYGRQGNIYTGDTQNTNTNALVSQFLGRETNVLYRQNYALTHEGDWDFGTSLAYVQYEKTRNRRLNEGLAGGIEGIFSDNAAIGFPFGFRTIELESYTAHGELNLPISHGFEQVVTLGAEWREERMDDPASNQLDPSRPQFGGDSIPGLDSAGRSTRSSARIASLFIENNIELRPGTLLTPGLRYDHHSRSGSNWSPTLNLSHELADNWSLKAGVARAYKAPNLYQSNPNYVLYSAGIGCWGGAGNGCYLQGNSALENETSINKELGVEYRGEALTASITWFHNDYRDKIEAGLTPAATTPGGRRVFKWENVDKAVVEGIEGNLNLPLGSALSWNNNFTYMLQSKNKDTGDHLSIIPQFTLNSSLDWDVSERLSLLASVVWYGKQEPKKYNYHGDRVTGGESRQVSPYAIAGLNATFTVNDSITLTGGVNNLFDKRLYREGNAQTTGTGPNLMYGVGANTYNEPGRTLQLGVTSTF